MDTTSSFGYWIRRQRKALDLTQQALADLVGCSLAAIKKIEGDERRPSRQLAERLADSLGVPANQRETFLGAARGLIFVDQLPLAGEPARAAQSMRTLQEPPRHNLPSLLTSFIGREKEMAEAGHLLANTRLLTLTGAGGTGKTRLSLQLAAEFLERNVFPDGVWWVEFASFRDPGLVTQTVASALGIREHPGQAILDGLMDYVRAKTMLLILDNCEHLIEACAQLAETLLHGSTHLKILASSREALGIVGETAYSVPSLPLPDVHPSDQLDALAQNECVRLFMDRSRAANPRFRLHEKNATAVVEICRRLDGIPLAIELAAARTNVFPPQEIAKRLDDRFRLLTGGGRTALERHQTLLALMDWSHNLLSEPERILLRRLAIFSGGWSFEAVQEVCDENLGVGILDLLSQLVNKSLVAFEEEAGAGRYHLLETIRQYARDKLFAAGETDILCHRHCAFFLRLAERAEPELRGQAQLEWLERVEEEHDNIRSALAWAFENNQSDQSLRLAGALAYFWELRAYSTEGQKWLAQTLTLSEQVQKGKAAAGFRSISSASAMEQRAKALYGAGRLSFASFADPARTLALGEASLELWQELGDPWWIAATLELVGVASIFKGDMVTARNDLEQGVKLGRDLKDKWPLAICLTRLGNVLVRLDLDMARSTLEEAVEVARAVGDRAFLTLALVGLCSIDYYLGRFTEISLLAEETLAAARIIGQSMPFCLSLLLIGGAAFMHGDVAKARMHLSHLLAIARETGQRTPALFAILGFGSLASSTRQPVKAVSLLVAFEALLHQSGINLFTLGGPFEMIYMQYLKMAQAQLDQASFALAQQEGHQLTLEQALALAAENEVADEIGAAR